MIKTAGPPRGNGWDLWKRHAWNILLSLYMLILMLNDYWHSCIFSQQAMRPKSGPRNLPGAFSSMCIP